jgi:hypothetical protein
MILRNCRSASSRCRRRRPGQLTLDHRDPTADKRDKQVIAAPIRGLDLGQLAYRHARSSESADTA